MFWMEGRLGGGSGPFATGSPSSDLDPGPDSAEAASEGDLSGSGFRRPDTWAWKYTYLQERVQTSETRRRACGPREGWAWPRHPHEGHEW